MIRMTATPKAVRIVTAFLSLFVFAASTEAQSQQAGLETFVPRPVGEVVGADLISD